MDNFQKQYNLNVLEANRRELIYQRSRAKKEGDKLAFAGMQRLIIGLDELIALTRAVPTVEEIGQYEWVD